ncbi:BQ5605_C030g10853 [Microbotryum silenes-dioicae]|uniref:BQ5605_C030g10853 protein n=1 Tax=Microbotryum silenes-dioicae TaxID=796604 RepID=A0A2X0NAY2_9BASI|nr:BQ5605_C030g10853 [Microbotryum silenes-dioicae]
MTTTLASMTSRGAFDDPKARFEAREETKLAMIDLDDGDPLDSLILRTSQILETSRSLLASTRSTRRAIERICGLSDDSIHKPTSPDLRPIFERFSMTESDLSHLGNHVEAFALHGSSSASSTLHRRIDSKALLMLPSNPTSSSGGVKLDGTGSLTSVESLRSKLQAPKVSTEEGDGLQGLPDWTQDRRSTFDRGRSPILAVTNARKSSPTPELPSAPISSTLPSRASALLRTISSSPSISSFAQSRPSLASTSLRTSADRPWSPPNTDPVESPTSSTDNLFSFSPGSPTSTAPSSLADASFEWESYSPLPPCASSDLHGSPRLGHLDEYDCRPTTPSPLGRRTMNTRSLNSNEVSPFATPTRANTYQIRLIADSPASISISDTSFSPGPVRSTSPSPVPQAEREENELLPELLVRPSLTTHHRRRSSSVSLRLPDSANRIHSKTAMASLTRDSSMIFAEPHQNEGGRGGDRSTTKGHQRNESGAMRKLLEQQERLGVGNSATLAKDGHGGSGAGVGGKGWWGYWNLTSGTTDQRS